MISKYESIKVILESNGNTLFTITGINRDDNVVQRVLDVVRNHFENIDPSASCDILKNNNAPIRFSVRYFDYAIVLSYSFITAYNYKTKKTS